MKERTIQIDPHKINIYIAMGGHAHCQIDLDPKYLKEKPDHLHWLMGVIEKRSIGEFLLMNPDPEKWDDTVALALDPCGDDPAGSERYRKELHARRMVAITESMKAKGQTPEFEPPRPGGPDQRYMDYVLLAKHWYS